MANDLSELENEMNEAPAAPPAGDALKQLQELGKRVLGIDAQMAELNKRLEERQKVRHDIVSRQMPELMMQNGVDRVGVDGRLFEIEDYYHASIKKDSPTRDEAYAWLEQNDAGDIISYTVTASFPKDSQEQVDALARYVRERYQSATVEVERGVPWKRLTSWLKELFERKAGDEPELKLPPLDVFGATVGQYVKIVEPVRPRAKRR